MRLRAILPLFVLAALLSIPTYASVSFARNPDLDEIHRSIERKGARWRAQDTSISRLRAEERRKRLGSYVPFATDKERAPAPAPGILPAALDWRDYNGASYVTTVKEQASCGACWSFAPTAALESNILISRNTPGVELDLSEQTLLSCNGMGTCYGGWIDLASDFIRDIGLPDETCCSYAGEEGFCSSVCTDWPDKSYKIQDWYKVRPTAEAIKYALYNHGPLLTLLAVHTDFYYYREGVYSQSWGSFEGYHAAVIVGYDDAGQYFIVKSSWGTDWGEEGYSRIAYSEMAGETQFGLWTVAYESPIPADFPTLGDIPRRASQQNAEKEVGEKKDFAPLSGLTGVITDGAGNPVSGVSIKVGKYRATTDSTGRYFITSIPAGDYTVAVMKSGYVISIESISILPKTTATRNFAVTASSSAGAGNRQWTERSKEARSDENRKKDIKAESSEKKYLGPGWFYNIRGTAVSHSEAVRYFEERRKGIVASRKTPGLPMASAAADITPEIQELARGLRHDPKLIYDYVHNHIDYVPYFGALKGATVTLLEGTGNDFDQAALMIALLRASGYTARYVFGTMNIPGGTLSNWLGVDQNAGAMCNALGFVYIPYDNLDDNGGDVTRVWVKATIDGTDYVFDPALKSYVEVNKIDLGQAMGYNRGSLMATATDGATITADYVRNLNELGLRNQLTTYVTNFVNTLRSQYPNSTVDDITGGRKIVQTNLPEYETSLPQATTITAVWDDIPAEYMATLRIRVSDNSNGQNPDIDIPYNMPDLGAKSFAVTFSNPSGGQRRPELRIDGSVAYYGNWRNEGTQCHLIITVDHPYYCSQADQETSQPMLVGANHYAIVTTYWGNLDRILQKRYEQLAKFKEQGLADDSWQVMGELLNITGILIYKQQNVVEKTHRSHMDMIPVFHHRYLVMEKAVNLGVNSLGSCSSTIFKHYPVDNDYEMSIVVKPMVLMGSGWEHGVLEQVMGFDIGMSTVKLLQVENARGMRIFYADQSNFSTIKPQLINYSAGDLQYIEGKVNDGSFFYLPEEGRIPYGQKYYMGYYIFDHGGIGVILGGSYGGDCIYSSCTPVSETYSVMGRDTRDKPKIFSESEDPVNMSNGAYLFDGTDLKLGGDAPRGLTFSRSYESSNHLEKRALGYGWSHNNDVYLTVTSDGAPALGARGPIDAAAYLIAQYINLDLLTNSDTIDSWMVASLTVKWVIDQMIDNAVTVHISDKKMEYIKLADGTYSPPPGVTAQLVKNTDNTFSLVERFGTRMDFNADRQISQVVDVDGNTMVFSYDGSKNLTSVRDAFNRTLTLSYSGGKISTVSDSANRSASYGYDSNNNLTSYTDPEGKTWTYTYDTDHRMTSLKNPLNITTATNVYDAVGQVKTQTVPRQGGTTATYNFYFSGYRNQEEDPAGHAITYYYDEKMREYAKENALGHKTIREFDGQDHIVKITDPRSTEENPIRTNYAYDGSHNLTEVTDALNRATVNTYDGQYRLTDTTDPLSHNTHFTYDAEHHLTDTINAVGNRVTSTYYDNGFRAAAIDAKGVVTSFSYDTYGNPQTTRTGSHPHVYYTYDGIGRMTVLTDQAGASTGFVYDARNLLTGRTDALGKTSSYTYDDAGRLTERTDRKGHTVAYAYTPADKLQIVTYPDASEVAFTYNALDRLTQMEDGIGTTTYVYDAAGRLTSATDPYGFTVGYAYDASGNLTTLTYPGSRTVSYTYDKLNRVETVTINWLNQTATYGYDEAGRLTSLTHFNGAVTAYGYDDANRLTGLENRKSDSAILSSYQFVLDANGNRTGLTQTEPYANVPVGGTTSYDYNLQRNRLVSFTGGSFSYDDEGQLSTGYGSSYAFDYEHRLTGIGSYLDYGYDGGGKRLRATRNGTETRYIHDAGGNVLAEADGDNNITRIYVYGRGLLAMATPENRVYCYHFNATGSTIAMTDEEQSVVNRYSYDPFGGIENQQEDMLGQDTKLLEQPYKFIGQYGVMTEPNGFYYMRARYYDPQVGRFISEDPIGFDGGDVNLYAYVNNNPVLGVDPWGLCGQTTQREMVAQEAGAGDIINRAMNADWGMIAAGGATIVAAAIGTTAGVATIVAGVIETSGSLGIGTALGYHALYVGGIIIAGTAPLYKIGWYTIKEGWAATGN